MLRASRKLWSIVAMSVCLVAVSEWALPAAAQRDKAKDAAVLKGTIGAIDSQNRSITLVMTSFDRKAQETRETEKVLEAPRDAVIIQDGAKTKLDSLKRGWPTTVKVEKDKAVHITVDGPSVRGQFKSTNAERATITVIAGRDMAEKIYHLLKSTTVTTKVGKAGKVQDLQAGADIVLTLSVEGDNTVIRIQPAPMEAKKRGE